MWRKRCQKGVDVSHLEKVDNFFMADKTTFTRRKRMSGE